MHPAWLRDYMLISLMFNAYEGCVENSWGACKLAHNFKVGFYRQSYAKWKLIEKYAESNLLPFARIKWFHNISSVESAYYMKQHYLKKNRHDIGALV